MKDKLRELAEWMRSINGHCAYALTEILDAEGDGGAVPDARPDLDPVEMNRQGIFVSDSERAYNDGWNDCREALLAAATQPKVQP